MRIGLCELKNFGSYKELEFDFENQGLTLIHGATGSGKSTLCDAIPWVLFGRTSKDGSVDEVLKWPSDGVTYGSVVIDGIYVTRIRGPKAKDNDFYFSTTPRSIIRGKDLADTQRLLNNALGFDCELYLSGAYFHEFSQTAQFFTSKAKERRLICEQIVDLTLAKKLQTSISESKKSLDKSLVLEESKYNVLKSNTEMLWRLQETENTKKQDWDRQQSTNLSSLLRNIETFETTRTKTIEKLNKDKNAVVESKTCQECGNEVKSGHKHNTRYYDKLLKQEQLRDNPYISQYEKLKDLINPHSGTVKDYGQELTGKERDLTDINNKIVKIKTEIGDFHLLQQVTNDYRSTSIENTIKTLEDSTNALLMEHFEGEIKVTFVVTDADKLEVEIQKDGNSCVYTQLSKGQRQLLKLCFGVSVMQAVSSHSGIKFEQIFFDEALDGLSDILKVKAYRLFQTLEHHYNGVFVVEHSSELKALFDKQCLVELIGGDSVLAKS